MDREKVLAAMLVLLAMGSTAVASLGTPLLPTIQAVDGVSLAASQWALTVTLVVGAVAVPLMGRLGDGRLRRPTTLGAVVVMLAGCILSALPAGFPAFLAGRALQGVGLGLVPLATAVARDHLPAQRSRSTIALIGITTAAGVGLGYPFVGLLAQYLGLSAPFWFVAALSALTLGAAAAVLPPSPLRGAPVDVVGAAVLGLGIAGLLVALAQGPIWGWSSATSIFLAVSSAALLGAWVGWELRDRHPLVDLRLFRRRSVLAANMTAFLVSVGFYPLAVLVVRFVQTPPAAGYGFGAPVVVAGLMLTPFSLASLAAKWVVAPAARRTSAELVVTASCVVLVASLALFLLARRSYWEIGLAMALDGLGVGAVFAVNPVQITSGVPPRETGSAISFYQLGRTVAYSVASALSATLLVVTIPAGREIPTDAGYNAAALVAIAVLVVAFTTSALFAVLRARGNEPAMIDGLTTADAGTSDR